MPAEHGFRGKVEIQAWDGASSQDSLDDISSHCTNMDLQRSTETSDVSGFNEKRKSSVSGQSDGTLNLQGNWHADVGNVMFGRGEGHELRTFKVSQTSRSGDPASAGVAIITQRSLSISKNDAIKFGLNCQISGPVTEGTVA